MPLQTLEVEAGTATDDAFAAEVTPTTAPTTGAVDACCVITNAPVEAAPVADPVIKPAAGSLVIEADPEPGVIDNPVKAAKVGSTGTEPSPLQLPKAAPLEAPAVDPAPAAAHFILATDVAAITTSILTAAKAAERTAVAAEASHAKAFDLKVDALKDALQSASASVQDGIREAYHQTMKDIGSSAREHAVATANVAVDNAIRSFESRLETAVSVVIARRLEQAVLHAVETHVASTLASAVDGVIEAKLVNAIGAAIDLRIETSAKDLGDLLCIKITQGFTESREAFAAATAPVPAAAALGALTPDAKANADALDAELNEMLNAPVEVRAPPPKHGRPIRAAAATPVKEEPTAASTTQGLPFGASPELDPVPSICDDLPPRRLMAGVVEALKDAPPTRPRRARDR